MTKSGKHCGKRRNCTFFCNFFFCHYVFKKPSAAEASESVYMRERVKGNLYVQNPKTERYKKSFNYSGSLLWNDLPVEIQFFSFIHFQK